MAPDTRPQVIYNPITAGNGVFGNVYLLYLDNTKRLTLQAPYCRNGNCRYVWAISGSNMHHIPSQFLPRISRKVLNVTNEKSSYGHKGPFTNYIYKRRGVGGQKNQFFVNFYTIENVNGGG